MSSRNYNKILEFLNENELTLDVPNNLSCTLCKKLVINCKITPCQCKYCETCIIGYLENGVKSCVGKTLFCNSIKLSLNENIKDDHQTNMQIFNMNIRCPHERCQFISRILEVCDHSYTCQYRPQREPINWGCEIAQGFESYYEEMALNNSTEIKQMKLIIEALKNDRKTVYENMVKENKALTEEVTRLTTLMTNFQSEITDLKSSKRKQNVEIDRLNKSNAELRKSLTKATNDIKDLESKGSNVLVPLIDPVKQNVEKINKEIKELSKHNTEIIKDISKYTKTNNDCLKSFKILSVDISRIEQQIEEICFNVGVLIYKMDKIESKSICAPKAALDDGLCMFTWQIPNFSCYRDSKLKRKLTSQDFHSSDRSYKIHFDLCTCDYGDHDDDIGFLSLFAIVKRAGDADCTGGLNYDISARVNVAGKRYLHARLKAIDRIDNGDIDYCIGVARWAAIDRLFGGDPPLIDPVDDSLTLEFLVKRR